MVPELEKHKPRSGKQPGDDDDDDSSDGDASGEDGAAGGAAGGSTATTLASLRRKAAKTAVARCLLARAGTNPSTSKPFRAFARTSSTLGPPSQSASSSTGGCTRGASSKSTRTASKRFA
eukprot:5796348-Alexandrium_andersonii.AAC.1